MILTNIRTLSERLSNPRQLTVEIVPELLSRSFYTYSCKCKNFCPLKMQFQLGQRIKGQMVCLSIHPDCWIEIQIRLYASKVQNNRIRPSINREKTLIQKIS